MDQALPTQFDNTAATWANMPMIAAMQTGQQNRIATDNNAALQAAYADEQAFKKQSRPVELSNLMATGDRTRSMIEHDKAMTRESGGRSDLADGTRAGQISSTNSKNEALDWEAKVKKGEAEGELYGQLASKLKNLPAGTPDFVKAQMVQQALGLPSDPRVTQGLLSKGNDLAGMLQDHADNIYKNTSEARKEAAKEAAASARQRENIQGQKELRQMDIDAGKYREKSAKAVASFEQNLVKLDPVKKLTALRDAAIVARQEGNEPLAASLEQRAMDPTLIDAAKAMLASGGGTGVVQQVPGQRPQIVPRSDNVPMATPPIGGGAPPAPQGAIGGGLEAQSPAMQQIIQQQNPNGGFTVNGKPPGQAAAPAGASLQNVMKMYPGIPPEKLREAYKKKFGVDLQ